VSTNAGIPLPTPPPPAPTFPPSTFDGLWFSWVPTTAPLSISFTDAQYVNSIWVPIFPADTITVSDGNGNLLHTMEPPGAEMVPVRNEPTVVLASSSSGTVYVFASSYAYPAYKEPPT
jgi:hypothetical protein